mmetsp:Transcript_58200/g.131858  ORF Transcript_58200/g.131858 Transcript_58200/m.131858 type:complete len:213 (+) Transcript_58200:1139-1777(+)
MEKAKAKGCCSRSPSSTFAPSARTSPIWLPSWRRVVRRRSWSGSSASGRSGRPGTEKPPPGKPSRPSSRPPRRGRAWRPRPRPKPRKSRPRRKPGRPRRRPAARRPKPTNPKTTSFSTPVLKTAKIAERKTATWLRGPTSSTRLAGGKQGPFLLPSTPPHKPRLSPAQQRARACRRRKPKIWPLARPSGAASASRLARTGEKKGCASRPRRF